jgi:DNA polymerase III alpha subunit (gram-positive type)
MQAIYLGMDNETGGLDENCTLLTTYLCALDKNLNKIDSLYLFLKENNDKPYVVEAGGLEVNKIDIIQHDKIAMPYSKGGQLLREFIKKHSSDGAEQLIPLGHNVHFDITGINNKLLSRGNWQHFVSYRHFDTQIYARGLQMKGVLPMDMSISLVNLTKFFNVKVPGSAHEAEYDTLATVEVAKCLLKL